MRIKCIDFRDNKIFWSMGVDILPLGVDFGSLGVDFLTLCDSEAKTKGFQSVLERGPTDTYQ